MKSILPVLRLWALVPLAYHRWALAEIHPLHADVPHIVRRIHALENA